MERQRPALRAAAGEHPRPVRRGRGGELGEQAGLADAGLAAHQHHPTPARGGLRDVRPERAELALAPHERAPVDRARRGRRRQRRVLGQDRRVQRAHLGPGLDAQLRGQPAAQPAVGVERLGLPAVAVEREHELRPRAFAQRMVGDHGLQHRHRLAVPTEGEHRRDAVLRGGRAQLREPGGLRTRERPGGELVECRSAPQHQRVVERGDGARVVTAGRGAAPGHDPRLGERGVAVRGVEQVARRPGADRDAAAVERPPQPQHVVLQGLRRRARRRAVPQGVDEPVLADDRAAVHRQHREQAAFLRPDRSRRAVAPEHLDRAEDPQGHHRHPHSLRAVAGRCPDAGGAVPATPSVTGAPRPARSGVELAPARVGRRRRPDRDGADEQGPPGRWRADDPPGHGTSTARPWSRPLSRSANASANASSG
nr:hypothetical protein [Pseudonocardia sp.]